MTVYTDQKRFTIENFATEIVLHWSLVLEEYDPKKKYTKGPDNEAADALSRLTLINSDVKESDITRKHFF